MLRSVAFLVLAASVLATAHGTPADPYTSPGRLIDVGGFRLNLYCAGSGSPTVIFDSGLEDWAPSWIKIQPAIAKRTRTCTYDRAGNGFSDPGPMPRTTGRIARELHTLLHVAGETGPFVLVGHSFGGLIVRHYADRYPRDVAGLVLVDASAEGLAGIMTAQELRDNDRDIARAQAMLRQCLTLAQRHFRSASPKLAHACPGMFFRGLPAPADFPRARDATLVFEAERPKQYAASASELENFTTASMRALMGEQRSYGAIPVLILVAMHHAGTPPRWERSWREAHRRWLSLSTRAQYVPATHSGHYIQFDQPALVIGAIEDVVATVRATR